MTKNKQKKSGFSSKTKTLKDAREKGKTITMQDVDDLLTRMLRRRKSLEV